MNYRFIISRIEKIVPTKPNLHLVRGIFSWSGPRRSFKQLGRSDDSFRERWGAQKLKLDGDFFMENPING